jgi:hypothetical protein
MKYRVTFTHEGWKRNIQRDILCSGPRTARDTVTGLNPGCIIVSVRKIKERGIPCEHLAEAAVNW